MFLLKRARTNLLFFLNIKRLKVKFSSFRIANFPNAICKLLCYSHGDTDSWISNVYFVVEINKPLSAEHETNWIAWIYVPVEYVCIY